MTTVRLPDGCTGLDMQDGAKYTASKQGGTVDMEPRHARAVQRGWYGQSGTMRGGPQFSFATKGGRTCPACGRRWHAWTECCHSCGTATAPE